MMASSKPSPWLGLDISIETPAPWSGYALIDCGSFEKLEQFGPYILRRPEPQAVWPARLSEAEWERLADASFLREPGNQEKGRWVIKPNQPEKWTMPYAGSLDVPLDFKLSLSSFKHVGIFPEQAVNWAYIQEVVPQLGPKPKVLNMFAYTGAASIVARKAGADVTHVDSIKHTVNWANENLTINELDGIRWMVEDALKFAKREVRRGNLYQGLILDPPAYGRGPAGEKWLLEEHINELLEACAQLVDPERNMFILSLYSLGFSSLITANLMDTWFPEAENASLGELYLTSEQQQRLPLGTFARFHRLAV